ncbi:MAG: hypothetical protein WCK67_12965 [bacterium]
MSDIFRKINLPLKIEEGLDNWIDKGKFIAFVSWTKKLGRFRKKALAENMGLSSNITIDKRGNNQDILNHEVGYGNSAFTANSLQRQDSFVVVDEVVYDGLDVKIVSPEAFVFDPSGKNEFSSCAKVYRSWATLRQLSNNEVYTNLDGLETLIQENSSSSAENKAVNCKNLEIQKF